MAELGLSLKEEGKINNNERKILSCSETAVLDEFFLLKRKKRYAKITVFAGIIILEKI
ncbi:MAG: hypothetical protein Q4C61_16555 [Lachnospiraceae bacterium]|nr:hypothetical protein [Lachnospiraceae bacterium]